MGVLETTAREITNEKLKLQMTAEAARQEAEKREKRGDYKGALKKLREAEEAERELDQHNKIIKGIWKAFNLLTGGVVLFD